MSKKIFIKQFFLFSILIVLGCSSNDWQHISLGGDHTCGIADNGELFCWGHNGSGQLGDGTNGVDDEDIPTRIGINSDWTHISLGGDHTCGINSGKLFCWGHNGSGQLGDGTNGADSDDVSTNKNIPTRIGINSDWTHISLGDAHSCGINSGKLFCWGHNGSGQLGDGTNGVDITDTSADKNIPTAVANDSDWTHISLGGDHTCGIRNNGELFCWGANETGQLGDGTNGADRDDISADKNIPTRIGNNSDWRDISLGWGHTCGIRNNGELFCWGYNSSGQLGDGTSRVDDEDISTDKNIPTRIGNNSDWQHISLGGYHTCGIRNNGELFCWGHSTNGPLGVDLLVDVLDKYIPTRIGNNSDWNISH